MNYAFADRTRNFTSSAVRDILTVIQKGNVISFAGGLPSEEFFPLEQVQLAYEKVFASGTGALQYGGTEGYLPLRVLLKERMKTKGIYSEPETILMTTGSQQAIDLFSKVMLSPSDIVLTENPTYLAALQVFKAYEGQVCAVQGDDYGMDPQDLENKIKMLKPKFIYVVPTFSNPEGKAWSQERRIAIVELAKKYNVLVFEDDPYSEIQFEDRETYQSLASLDQERTHVLYTSTFSKTVVPALRSGWITGPKEVIRMMAQAKQASDLHSSSIDQQALYFLMRDFDLNRHIALLSREYYQRMNVMRNYLNTLESFSFTEPKGGMFIWVKADKHLDMTSLLHEAVNNGVAYVPGSAFYVDNPQKNTFRLNFTHSTPENIKLGMMRLSEVLRRVEKVM
ncbi:aminotransferase [Anaerobacillus alkalidiazotrophicus]|uniref:Aminotransferase n=1 Tax=Anaerobacillus alkalidiazotrophicus TaxID=472963 RepID=A0A1S2LYM7_9BACI|nr:PLP-dependent aminotransferase family protein [Anaerobacillus alkalidiazotrophicus]OIJ16535.1 aminotransferase [Anaerobacillus alkalidiazotrophicus]